MKLKPLSSIAASHDHCSQIAPKVASTMMGRSGPLLLAEEVLDSESNQKIVHLGGMTAFFSSVSMETINTLISEYEKRTLQASAAERGSEVHANSC